MNPLSLSSNTQISAFLLAVPLLGRPRALPPSLATLPPSLATEVLYRWIEKA